MLSLVGPFLVCFGNLKAFFLHLIFFAGGGIGQEGKGRRGEDPKSLFPDKSSDRRRPLTKMSSDGTQTHSKDHQDLEIESAH